tara:strand:- start:1157 stop:1942 length:786 start_codon:yes stop_codon:yes gene_type:complete
MEKIQIVNISEENYDYNCRICLEEDLQDNLIAPCDCSGTQKYIHTECLNKWRLVNLDNEKYSSCEICKRDFIIINNFETETIIYEFSKTLKCKFILYLILNYYLGTLIALLDIENNYKSFNFISFGTLNLNSTIVNAVNVNAEYYNTFTFIYYTSIGIYIISMLFFTIHTIVLLLFLKRKLEYARRMFLYTFRNFILSFNMHISYITYILFQDPLFFYMSLYITSLLNFMLLLLIITNHNITLKLMNKDIDNQIIMSINDD